MKSKKGFTLIELLAVIVILAVIALIATPIILGLIDDSKKNSFKASAYGISQAAKNAFVEIMYAGAEPKDITYKYTNGVETSDPNGYALKYEGAKPQNGLVSLTKDGKVSLLLHDGKYCATKGATDAEVTIEEKTLEECMPPLVDQSGANAPVLTAGMTAVMWDGTNWVAATNIDDPYHQNWYDYDTDSKKWANARTNDGSLWVWIPRYAYQITTGYHTSSPIDLKAIFLSGNTNTPANNDPTAIATTPTYSGNSQTNYIVHPAFKFGSNEVSGMWVAKFEASRDGSNRIKSLPNASAWRDAIISVTYAAALDMKNNAIYGWSATQVDTHIAKQREWGAIAFLSTSKYGQQLTPIWINNSSTYITGCAGDAATGSTYAGCQNTYNTVNGVKASTTGNIYGIYDMNGGAFEFVMANHDNLSRSSGFASVAAIPDKYIDRYPSGQTFTPSTFGDATYEICTYSDGGCWFGDTFTELSSSYPWMSRGGYSGYATSGLSSGIYSSFRNETGGGSFRVIVLIGTGL